MTKKLHIITCQPSDKYFLWQLQVQLSNLKKYEMSNLCTVLVYKHNRRLNNEGFEKEWKELEDRFPEAKFVYYEDPSGDLHEMMGKAGYIPLLRPWLLAKHFKVHPELKDDAILYMDSDVVFTRKPDFSKLIDNDICYLSSTKPNEYIAASYFDSKVKDVKENMKEQYQVIDVLDGLLQMFGLRREIAEENENNSGGAQYLLKNIDHLFWENVFKGCITTILYLRGINKRFFESEEKGFQSWCADMWSILFNLWKNKQQTACPKEMDFCWATDLITRWHEVQIYHDAGATSKRPIKEGHRLFHKREANYIDNRSTPFEDDLSWVSQEYCSGNYVKEIEEARIAMYSIIPSKITEFTH